MILDKQRDRFDPNSDLLEHLVQVAHRLEHPSRTTARTDGLADADAFRRFERSYSALCRVPAVQGRKTAEATDQMRRAHAVLGETPS